MFGLRVLLLLQCTPLASDSPPNLQLHVRWKLLRWVLGFTRKANPPDAATAIYTGLFLILAASMRLRIAAITSPEINKLTVGHLACIQELGDRRTLLPLRRNAAMLMLPC